MTHVTLLLRVVIRHSLAFHIYILSQARQTLSEAYVHVHTHVGEIRSSHMTSAMFPMRKLEGLVAVKQIVFYVCNIRITSNTKP